MLVQFLAIAGSMIIFIVPIPKATAQIPKDLSGNLPKVTLLTQPQEQTQFLEQIAIAKRSVGIAAGGTITMVIMSWGVRRWQKRLNKNPPSFTIPNPSDDQPITTLLNKQQQQHLQEVKTRLFQLAQSGIWVSGSFIILGLFPATQAHW